MAIKFKGLSALGVVLALAAAPALAAPTAPVSSAGTAIAIMQASEALSSDNCDAALGPLNQLWHDPYFESSDPDMAADYRLRLVACTAEKSGLKEALSLSTENIARPGANLTAYDMHAFLQLSAAQPGAAADTLDAAMTRFPDKAPDLSDLTVLGTLALLHDDNATRELALLDHSERVHWQVHILGARPAMGLMRLEGLRAAVAAKADDLAALYRADLKTEAFSYMVSQGDGLVSDAAVAPDAVEPIIGAQITEAKAAVVKAPTDLGTLGYLMTLERSDGQPDVALTQLNGIIALIDQYGLQNFQDPDMYGELLSDRALLLADMGQYPQALAAFQDGAKRLEGLPAGDFYTAYAGFLVARGNDQGAIDLISTMDVSGFSDVQKLGLIVTDACAFGRTHDTANYNSFMGVIGDPSARVRPKVCAGDDDGAASDLIATINVPQSRSTAILMMQNMAQGLAPSPAESADQTAMMALRTRADVAAAANAAAILVRTWPLRY